MNAPFIDFCPNRPYALDTGLRHVVRGTVEREPPSENAPR